VIIDTAITSLFVLLGVRINELHIFEQLMRFICSCYSLLARAQGTRWCTKGHTNDVGGHVSHATD